MRINKLLCATAIAAAAVAASPATAAVNVGDTVTCDQVGSGSFSCSRGSATIGSGAEFNVGNGGSAFLSADFAQGMLQIVANQSGNLTGTILNFTDLTDAFTSFALTSNNGFNNYNLANSSLSNGVLQIDLRGTNFRAGSTLNYTVNSLGAVPEPATWALMILGMAAVGFAMRRRKNVNMTVRFA